MAREEKTLDLKEETWAALEQFRKSLNHEDLEETLETLITLGTAALAVSSSAQRKVRILGQAQHQHGEPCKHCGQVRIVQGAEVAVEIGISRPT